MAAPVTGGEGDSGAPLGADQIETPVVSFLRGGDGEKREAAVTTMGKVVAPYACGNGRARGRVASAGELLA